MVTVGANMVDPALLWWTLPCYGGPCPVMVDPALLKVPISGSVHQPLLSSENQKTKLCKKLRGVFSQELKPGT